MATTASIRTLLAARLAAIEGIPDIAAEGVKYAKVVGTPFVRMKLMPAESTNSSIGESWVLELHGLAQIDVFYPALRGIADAEAMAQAVVDQFAPGVYLDDTDQIVIDSVWVEAVREETPLINVPVMLRWRAHRTK